MRQILLTEYKKSDMSFQLSTLERDTIAGALKSVTIEPEPGRVNSYFLTPSSTIGVLETDSLAIRIRPKMPIERVLFLISYSLDPSNWFDIGFNLGETDSLFEAIIPAFTTHVQRAFSRGILQGYRTVEDSSPTVRGQIRFPDQIHNRYGIYPPLEIRFDEFTDDIVENQLIKAAIGSIARKQIRSSKARRHLRSFEFALQNVSLMPFDFRNLPEVRFTRLNNRYRAAINLAKLILRSSSFEFHSGKVRATSFLIDMNNVFEDFVATALRETLRLSLHEFPQSAAGKRLRLDEAGQIGLEPDISWWQGNKCCFVGDVKYKRVNVKGIKHSDIYQLLAYTIAAGIPEGLLIYAKGESDPAIHKIVMASKKLTVMGLDLAGSPDEVLGQIQTVAQEVKSQRSKRFRTGAMQ
eukprot:COSAG01_NODE_46_length_32080_cov_716.589319_15_plen_409_part_00